MLNIGNTWSASLQATGALLPWDAKNFDKIGGKDRFVDSALGSTGVEGQDPAAVPLYSMAYALYYNKQMFADAGITEPPATWDELVEAGKKVSGGGKWGLGAEGSNLSNNIHQIFVLAKQRGADFFTADGKPDFTSDGAVLTSDSTLRFRSLDELDASLVAAGFVVGDVRDAPDRPGLELVVIASRDEDDTSSCRGRREIGGVRG